MTLFEGQARLLPFNVQCHALPVEAKEGGKTAHMRFVRNAGGRDKSVQELLLFRSSARVLDVEERDDSGRVDVLDAAAVGVSRIQNDSLRAFLQGLMRAHAYGWRVKAQRAHPADQWVICTSSCIFVPMRSSNGKVETSF